MPAEEIRAQNGLESERRRWRTTLGDLPNAVVLLLLLLAVAAPVLHFYLIRDDFVWTKNDLTAVWVGMQAARHGADPYSAATTRAIQTMYYGRALGTADDVNRMGFAYPEYIALVLAPLAWLPFAAARLVYLAVIPLLMALTVPAWLRVLGLRPDRRELAILVVLTLASWPMMWGLRLSQATLVVAALVALGCFLLVTGRDALGGVVLSLALIKPQLVGLLLVFLMVWAARHRRWRLIAGVVSGATLLLLYAHWLDSGWLSRWVGAMTDYAQYTHPRPTLLGLFGPWLGFPLMAAIAWFGGLTLWRGSTQETAKFGGGMALALALTLSLMPTSVTLCYNDVLLLPAILILACERGLSGYAGALRGVALVLLAAGYLAVPVAIVGESLRPHTVFWETLPLINILLPIAVAVAIILTMRHGNGEVLTSRELLAPFS